MKACPQPFQNPIPTGTACVAFQPVGCVAILLNWLYRQRYFESWDVSFEGMQFASFEDTVPAIPHGERGEEEPMIRAHKPGFHWFAERLCCVLLLLGCTNAGKSRSDGGAQSSSEPASGTETFSQGDADSDGDIDGRSSSSNDADTDGDGDRDSDSDTHTERDADADSETDTEAGSGTQADIPSDTASDTPSSDGTVGQTDFVSDTMSDTEPQGTTDDGADTDSSSDTDTGIDHEAALLFGCPESVDTLPELKRYKDNVVGWSDAIFSTLWAQAEAWMDPACVVPCQAEEPMVDCQTADCTTTEGAQIEYRLEKTYESYMGTYNLNITETTLETLTLSLPQGAAGFERIELSRYMYHWEEYGLGETNQLDESASWWGTVDSLLPATSSVARYVSDGNDGGMGSSEGADFSSEQCDISWLYNGALGEHEICVSDDCRTVDNTTTTVGGACVALDPDTWESVGSCLP